MAAMGVIDRLRALEHLPATRLALMALGVVLMVGAPIVGILPGPGGVFVFAAGLTLVLRYSLWAKRRYVDFKRRYPKPGAWTDWGLRRASARRRVARDQAMGDAGDEAGKLPPRGDGGGD